MGGSVWSSAVVGFSEPTLSEVLVSKGLMMFRGLNLGTTAGTLIALGLLTALGFGQSPPQGPARDTPAHQRDKAAAGKIAGRVLGADNGRPLSRALVRLGAPDLPGGRSVLTDISGGFEFADLPAGRYTVTASKTGYVGLAYGQRRPRQAGTPLQVAMGQELNGIEIRLPRGGAISGHVYDETGDPLPGAAVRVMRYQYAQGARQLAPAGGGQTDDRGEFRIWGLDPGEYYVSAVARNFSPNPGGRVGVSGPAGRGGIAFGRGGPLIAAAIPPDDPDQEGYAPTYYPGVPSVFEARAVAVGLAAEVLGIDFNVLLVRTSRVSGRVTHADGSAMAVGNVTLVPEGAPDRGTGPMGVTFGARIQGDGNFTIMNVPPGRYTLRATASPSLLLDLRGGAPRDRGNPSAPPQYGSMSLTVNGDITDLTLALAPGATIAGTVTLEARQSVDVPNVSQLRISAPSLDVSPLDPNLVARVDRDGRFTIEGVPGGLHWIRARTPPGWALKSVVVDGRDVTDTPFDVRSSETIDGVSLLFTDTPPEINGTITDQAGTPTLDFTVLAFPTDSTLWRPQARQIMTARPDQNGRFQLRGLPPGDYYLTAIDPAEQGEWYDPAFLDLQRAGAKRVRLGEGDVRTQDLRVGSR